MDCIIGETRKQSNGRVGYNTMEQKDKDEWEDSTTAAMARYIAIVVIGGAKYGG